MNVGWIEYQDFNIQAKGTTSYINLRTANDNTISINNAKTIIRKTDTYYLQRRILFFVPSQKL